MEFTVAKKTFLHSLSLVARASEAKATMPALSHVLVQATGDKVLLSCTDLYLGAIGKVEAEVKRQGSVGVVAKDLLERVKMMPDGPIVLSMAGDALTLKAAGKARKFILRTMPGADFPPLPKADEGGVSTKVPSSIVARLLDQVLSAASTDETRQHLNSVKVEWDGDNLRMVTTDGHRLNKADGKVAGSANQLEFMLPRKGAIELRKLCDTSDEIAIATNAATVWFDTGFTLTVKLAEGTFPPYDQVIPRTDAVLGSFEPKAAIDVLRAVSVAAHERTGGVRVEFTKGSSTVRVATETPDRGEASDEFELEQPWEGKDIKIGFSAAYVIEALAAFDGGTVQIQSLSSDLDPIRLGADGLVTVIMPMRI